MAGAAGDLMLNTQNGQAVAQRNRALPRQVI